MTTDADRIDARELDGMAWAIRDLFLNAARDDRPSAAATALLAIVRDRAPAALRRIIETHGFAAYTQLHPERGALWEHLKTISHEMSRDYIDQLAASQQAAGARHRGIARLRGADLAKLTERACTGLKTALSAIL